MCGVQDHTRAAGALAQTVQVEVADDGVGPGFDGLQGFVAGGGAEVEEFAARWRSSRGTIRLRAGVHLAVVEKVGFGREQECFGDRDCGGFAVVGGPGVEEPGGRRVRWLGRGK